jgi:phage/plasmid primase-like uncharacterized protein
MLAPVIDPASGVHLGTHFTYITQQYGGWRKSPIVPAKITLGSLAGGVIPLSANALTAEAVLLAEGIEDALTAALMHPQLGVLAAVSVGNLAAISFPPHVRLVVLVRQRDGTNGGVYRAREKAIRRWLAEGRCVEVLDPPPGVKDINEAWQRCLARQSTVAGAR